MATDNDKTALRASQPSLPPSTSERILEIQDKYLRLQQQEIENTSQAERLNHELSLAALKAQYEDRKNERGYKASREKLFGSFSMVAFIVLSMMATYAIKLGHSSYVFELVKNLGLIIGGWLGGWGYARGRYSALGKKDDG